MPKINRFRSARLFRFVQCLAVTSLLIAAGCSEQDGSQDVPQNDFPELDKSSIGTEKIEIKAILESATVGLEHYLAKIPEGMESNYGFNDRQELSRAVLGIPIEVYRMDDAFLSERSDVQNTPILETDTWRVPVMVDGRHAALLLVTEKGGAFRTVGIGAAPIAEELTAIKTALGAASASKPFILVMNYKLKAEFAAVVDDFGDTSAERFYPLRTARMALGTINGLGTALDGNGMLQKNAMMEMFS